ncbi:polysaccharide deacetylase [Streptomyces sp. NBRC 110611]|uniref:polysaccharide deacetylase family protein n=1 Tax=Streptomyces sp. NBRC 110611 TaxID=1621259 RepID=UPI00082C0F8E|nr:polysaccharide deacetylase family protein [Streptomyces sp. NBRC 110611]GAU69196.1 polysaccharide deacetylase [Streptomyces sp. NBRC 110611]
MRPPHRSGGMVAAASAVLLFAACSTAPSPPDRGRGGPPGGVREAGGHAAVADPATVRADELGAVPVLMYHQLVTEPRSVYDRTPQDFRAELERLARERYVPVTARDFSGGKIDIPAGTHPVVLTFDDSTVSQFRLGPDGRPASDTAVGILLDVARKHPGFRPVATFFVNADPFREPGGRTSLDWLVKHGFEVGNHTLRHTALGTVDDAEVQEAIADNQRAITQAVPRSPVVSMALPHGSMPHSRQLAQEGAADGVRYRHQGVYLVGSNPAPSPFSTAFDPVAIPRIRSQEATGPDAPFTSAAWLDKLRDGTVRRYTSDGDPKKISFPGTETDRLAPAHRQAARPY